MRLVIVLAIFAAWIETPGCERRIVDTAELEAEVREREAPIRAEIAALGAEHPWAGVYSRAPDFTGTTVLVAPSSGCLAYDRGCLGIFSLDWGTVSVRDGRVHVAFEKRGSGTHPHGFEQEYTIEGTGVLRCLLPVRNDAYGQRLCSSWRSR